MEPISRSEPNTASTTEVRLATNDCCYWTSAHNGRLREVRHKPAGQPVLPSHPTPLHPFPSSAPLFTPRTTAPMGVVVRLAGYLVYCTSVLLLQLQHRHAARHEGTLGADDRQAGDGWEGMMRYPWVPDGTTADQRIAVCAAGQACQERAVATSRPKLSTQPRPELRPQAGPEVRREPTRSPMLPRLCWCAARSIEAMHAPAVKLHHLAAQFYLTLAPTRHSTQLRPYQRSK